MVHLSSSEGDGMFHENAENTGKSAGMRSKNARSNMGICTAVVPVREKGTTLAMVAVPTHANSAVKRDIQSPRASRRISRKLPNSGRRSKLR